MLEIGQRVSALQQIDDDLAFWLRNLDELTENNNTGGIGMNLVMIEEVLDAQDDQEEMRREDNGR